MQYLFDTNIILALIRDRPLGRFLAATYPIDPLDPPLLCIVTLGEIRSLAGQFGWQARKVQQMHSLLLAFSVVELGVAGVIDAYVEVDLAGRVNRGGARILSKNDLWIAATARASGATLLTTDQDFDALYPGLIQRICINPSSTLLPPAP